MLRKIIDFFKRKEPEPEQPVSIVTIDGHQVYITGVKYVNGKLELTYLPDPTLPPHFTKKFINSCLYDIIDQITEKRSSNGN